MGKCAGKKLSSGFKSEKQLKRLQNVSKGFKSHFRKHCEPEYADDSSVVLYHPFSSDHTYSSLGNEGFPLNPVIDVSDTVFELNVDLSWRQGRRVIELGVLADGLSACKQCGMPLQLSHTESIITYGLAAILKVTTQ